MFFNLFMSFLIDLEVTPLDFLGTVRLGVLVVLATPQFAFNFLIIPSLLLVKVWCVDFPAQNGGGPK